jgi:putative hydrolase of the HAD superfamily
VKPQNIIFDLGNVIVDIDESKTFRALSLLVDHPPTGRIPAVFSELIEKYECGGISTEAFIEELHKRSTKDSYPNQIIQAWNAMLLDIPRQRLDLMQQLRQSYGIYILSNTNPLHIAWVDNFLQVNYGQDSFSAFCDYALYSHDAGFRKPQEKIYSELLERAGITAESAVFFDDKEENIRAAQSVGLRAIHSPPNIDIRTQCAVFL